MSCVRIEASLGKLRNSTAIDDDRPILRCERRRNTARAKAGAMDAYGHDGQDALCTDRPRNAWLLAVIGQTRGHARPLLQKSLQERHRPRDAANDAAAITAA